MGEKNILKIREKINIVGKNYNSILDEIKVMRENDEIIKFEKLKSELSALGDEYNILKSEYTKLYQEECNHPLWVFISDQTDSYEQRQLWLCKCARCGKEEIGHSRKFKELINTNKNISYYDIYNNYNQFLDSNYNEEQSISLVKKLIKSKNNIK